MSMKPTDNERDKAISWLTFSILLALTIGAAGMVLTMPISYFTAAASPATGWQAATSYFTVLKADPLRVIHGYQQWLRAAMAQGGMPPVSWLVVLGMSVAIGAIGAIANPYSFDYTTHGSAREATYKDVKKAGLIGNSGIILGRWGNSFKAIRNWETLSALCVAPPGTGKTVGLIANILANWPDRERATLLGLPLPWTKRSAVPGPCMIINDPKGEMYEKTAGWRSTLGPVFKLSWGDPRGSSRWNPLSPRSYRGGKECHTLRAEVMDRLAAVYREPADAIGAILVLQRDGGGAWGNAWAGDPAGLGGPLADGVTDDEAEKRCRALVSVIDDLQAAMSMREQHLDRMCTILVPETVEHHWKITGREFLSGAIGYIIARAERLGIEPTFGLLLDALTTTAKPGGFRDPMMRDAGYGGEGHSPNVETIEGLGTEKNPTGGDADQDKTEAVIQSWVDECVAYGYPSRVKDDLYTTVMKPPNERGSVVSTAGSAINIFKNASVRAVTSSCDFDLEDLRGIDGKPTTFYIPIPLADAEVFGRVTGLFIETAAAWGISQTEKEIQKTRPILLIADEFWTLPPLQSLLQIPALGRGQWFQLMIVGQSYGQIGVKYRTLGGSEVTDTLKGSTAYKIIPTQTDLKTAKEISESIGNRTVRQESVGRQALSLGSLFSKNGADPGSRNINTSMTGLPLIPPDRLMSMPKLDTRKKEWGWQVVQVIGMMNRPIVCRPYLWFKDPVMAKRVGMPVKVWEAPDARNDNAAPEATAVPRCPA